MNMAQAPDTASRQSSQENLLLDYVYRLEKHKGGRKAVQVHLSRLKPFNRRDHHVRVAANSFEAMVKAVKGQLFILKSCDLIFIFKREATPDVETAVQRVRFLFSDDPLLAEEALTGDRFATWFDAENQFDEILNLAQSLIDKEMRRQSEVRAKMDTRAALKARQELGEPLTPEILNRVEAALTRADLSNLVRRQFACILGPKGAPEPTFSELFISIKDMRETMLPGVNLTSNRWLFQHLTYSLDRRMLAMLAKTDHITISGDISFNLNVSTLLSQEFLAFDDAVPASRRGHMVVELENLDIFSDLEAYTFAREFVQERGYRICVDGLTHQTFALVDRKRLGADLIKLIWHSDMVDGGKEIESDLRSLVRRAGENRVVLCRCDDREAVDFGRSIGIDLFQGRHIEHLIAEENRKRDLRRLKARIQNN
jgi:hypothetical protein